MKANELMTGDWVLIKRTPNCEYPYKICSINNYSILGEDYADWIEVEAGEEINLEDIKPIPLTAEILEKNGYTQSLLPKGYAYKFEDDRVMTLERFADYWVVRIYGNQIPMECRSVHELQHALRLCGIDKEMADNFKV